MAKPTVYNRQNSFALLSAENPGEPHSGTTLDIEFNAIKVSSDETQALLNAITDDDGVIARNSVGRAQLDASVNLGFGAPSTWDSDTTYTADVDTVFHELKFYIAATTHVSGVSFEAANWLELADFTATSMIDDLSVTAAKLAANAVTTAKITDSNVTTAKLAPDAVTGAKLADDAVDSEHIAAGAIDLEHVSTEVIPAGVIWEFAGASAPTGWLLCYGQEVSRATYPALFTAIGTTYGSGDGSTTFDLPDLRGRVVAGKDNMGGTSANRLTDQTGGLDGDTLGDTGGSETHVLTAAQLAAHTHAAGTLATASDGAHTHTTVGGGDSGGGTNAFWLVATDGETLGTSSNGAHTHTVSGSTASAGSDGAHNNVQPTIILNKIIKAH